jgi:hypothetical protein
MEQGLGGCRPDAKTRETPIRRLRTLQRRLEGRSIAAAVSTYITRDNRAVNSSSGYDGRRRIRVAGYEELRNAVALNSLGLQRRPQDCEREIVMR